MEWSELGIATPVDREGLRFETQSERLVQLLQAQQHQVLSSQLHIPASVGEDPRCGGEFRSYLSESYCFGVAVSVLRRGFFQPLAPKQKNMDSKRNAHQIPPQQKPWQRHNCHGRDQPTFGEASFHA